jgi:serine/threonine-protein kinase
MIGRILSHYRVVERIGSGGMGVVYLAHDERLERDVALKVLPERAVDDEVSRRRFRNEARALSRLNHPHIATVHDFDTSEGVDFLVMEYVSGTTLDRRLHGEAFSMTDAISVAQQIAEALEQAHEQGVVHRDLKPGNIILSHRGQVKVLDFGLAKLFEHGGESVSMESLSESQGMTGTLPYMAPEQILPGRVDPRTDLYALGAVLFEMVTGQRPFRERSTIALANAILHQPPPNPRDLNPDVSPRLAAAILRCLEKDPGDRFESAAELRAELARVSAGAPARRTLPRLRLPKLRRGVWIGAAAVVVVGMLAFAVARGGWRIVPGFGGSRIRSLAVLPLQNLSGDPEQEFFADGMTDELITNLARIGALRVISRTSVMRYKKSDKTLPQIARELNVDAVVEGAVMRSGEQVRITAQLVESSSDQNIWGDSYDRRMGDVLAMQQEVARTIAEQIQNKLVPHEHSALASADERSSADPEAHEIYLKARYYAGRNDAGSLRLGIDYFQQAAERSPAFAPAYSGLAASYIALAYAGGMSPSEALAKSKEAAGRALALDETLAEAHAAMAQARMYGEWDWAAAGTEFKRAIELDPGVAMAHNGYATYLSAMGRHEQAIAEAKRAQELDPLSLAIRMNLGLRYYYARQYDQAIEQLQRTLEMERADPGIRYWLGLALAQAKRYPEAITELDKVEGFSVAGPLGYVYAASGRRDQATSIATDLTQLARSRSTAVSPFDVAVIYAGLGGKDEAMKWMERALDGHRNELIYLRVDPMLDGLRGDPRFDSIVRKVGLEG